MAGSYGRGARVRTLVPSRILPDASLLKRTAAVERSRLPRCDRACVRSQRVGAGCWMRVRRRALGLLSRLSLGLLSSRDRMRIGRDAVNDTPAMVSQDL